MINIILILLGICTFVFSIIFIYDLFKKKNKYESNTSYSKTGLIGFVTVFFDTLGIGSFAPTTSLFKATNQVENEFIPGTLNVATSIPVFIMAFIFISSIKVEAITLFSMIFSAMIGSMFAASMFKKFSKDVVKLILGIALLFTSILMTLGQFDIIDSLGVGNEIGLKGIKLIFAVILNAIFGGFQAFGLGMYAPSMALVYFLGLSPEVAYPIMMGSSAFALFSASTKYIFDDNYNKKASISISIFGTVGVLIAAYIVKSLPIYYLTWLVIIVIIYTSFSLLISKKNR